MIELLVMLVVEAKLPVVTFHFILPETGSKQRRSWHKIKEKKRKTFIF